ncbi:hypothetical protein NC653_028498 [Populus alba x Populus x berolinensis]|uniref:Uncharacterized protein n=1 Tax=Populus alba x Populus x berolinensis TaxID=444605 RepID=A0AAD6Q263_9ROSI|nr:hypothetical protein NC653_028498 [Populus alba x Populus x berolinensis]
MISSKKTVAGRKSIYPQQHTVICENPLNIAAAMGHVDFVKEIIRLKPVFSREVNQEGFSPMHIAADNGQVEIVKELMKVDIKLCRLEGRQKMTPFHHAAIRGRAEVVRIVSKMRLNEGENALHLAVRNIRFEAIKKLVDWIRHMNKEYLLNMKDEQGNTVLHLASWKKQRRVVEIFLGSGSVSTGSLECWSNESKRYCPLYCYQQPRPLPTTPQHQRRCWSNRDNLVEYFKFKKDRDSPSEARGTLLVIAGFGCNCNVPSWSQPSRSNTAHFVGQSIYGRTTNTVGFMLFVFLSTQIGFFHVSLQFSMSTQVNSPCNLSFKYVCWLCIVLMAMRYHALCHPNLYLICSVNHNNIGHQLCLLWARSVRPLYKNAHKIYKGRSTHKELSVSGWKQSRWCCSYILSDTLQPNREQEQAWSIKDSLPQISYSWLIC